MPRESEEVEVHPWEVLQDDVVNVAGRMLAIDSINMTSPSDREVSFSDNRVMFDTFDRLLIKNLEFTFRCRSGETFCVPGHELMRVRRFTIPGNRGRSGETGEEARRREEAEFRRMNPHLFPGQGGDIASQE
jgi:hypothetical protein